MFQSRRQHKVSTRHNDLLMPQRCERLTLWRLSLHISFENGNASRPTTLTFHFAGFHPGVTTRARYLYKPHQLRVSHFAHPHPDNRDLYLPHASSARSPLPSTTIPYIHTNHYPHLLVTHESSSGMSSDRNTPSKATNPSLDPANVPLGGLPPSISDLAEQLSDSRVDHRPDKHMDELASAFGEKWAPNATREEAARGAEGGMKDKEKKREGVPRVEGES